jgi:hypothetical protein
VRDSFKKGSTHLALDDIRESIAELRTTASISSSSDLWRLALLGCSRNQDPIGARQSLGAAGAGWLDCAPFCRTATMLLMLYRSPSPPKP